MLSQCGRRRGGGGGLGERRFFFYRDAEIGNENFVDEDECRVIENRFQYFCLTLIRCPSY